MKQSKKNEETISEKLKASESELTAKESELKTNVSELKAKELAKESEFKAKEVSTESELKAKESALVRVIKDCKEKGIEIREMETKVQVVIITS